MLKLAQFKATGMKLWLDPENDDGVIWFFLSSRSIQPPRAGDEITMLPRTGRGPSRTIRVLADPPLDAARTFVSGGKRGIHSCTGFFEFVDV